MAGLTNAQYAQWLNNTAATDCSDVSTLTITNLSGAASVYTDSAAICNLLENSNANDVSGWDKVVFEGTGESGAWKGIDIRETDNLERTLNENNPPPNIKRPKGS